MLNAILALRFPLYLRCAFLCSFALVVLSWAPLALANAPAPPSYAWFHFQAPRPFAIKGAQLAECSTLTCDRPMLLIQAGTCDDPGCLQSPPLLGASYRFDCANNTCLLVEPRLSDRAMEPYVKLIAQFSDRLRTTKAFRLDIKNPLAGYAARNLRVTVRSVDLAIAPDAAVMKPTRWELFWTALSLTEGAELSIAALFLGIVKVERKEFVKTLITIAFINLLTFPVVWFFFPALQPFQYTTTRVFAVVSLAMAIVFSSVLATRSTVTLKTLRNLLLGWLLSLPVVLAIGFLAALVIGYGEWLPSAFGIPSIITLPASELFAVTWEAWLIYCVSKVGLPLFKIGLLSLLMNAASLILGLLFLPAMQSFG